VVTGTLDEQRTAFYTVWVRKEAVVKARGEGLTGPMRSFVVSAPGEPAEVVSATPRSRVDRSLRLRDLQIDSSYAAALATTFPCTEVTSMDLSSILSLSFGASGPAEPGYSTPAPAEFTHM
jgi:4'-phosphopantetheinyl transferase